jgi:hypothetical protein
VACVFFLRDGLGASVVAGAGFATPAGLVTAVVVGAPVLVVVVVVTVLSVKLTVTGPQLITMGNVSGRGTFPH